jgi:hypothetical protein
MRSYQAITDQQGAVMVIAVVMLLILSVIGIYAVGSSTVEIKIAAQKRFYDTAFNDADGGIDYIRTLNPFGGIDLSNPPSNPVTYNAPNSDFNFTVNVSYLGSSLPKVGSGTGQRAGFKQHYHLIESTGRDAPIALRNAQVELELEGYRIGF